MYTKFFWASPDIWTSSPDIWLNLTGALRRTFFIFAGLVQHVRRTSCRLVLLDFVIELIWNILCISSRIIALSLFATIYRYWFAGIVIVHIIVIFLATLRKDFHENKQQHNTDSEEVCITAVVYSLGLGIGYLFNVLLVRRAFRSYVFYMCYWLVLMVETIILITVWYFETKGEGLWYHEASIACIIPAYFISFVIKTLHVSTFAGNKGKSIWNWKCYHMPMIRPSQGFVYGFPTTNILLH